MLGPVDQSLQPILTASRKSRQRHERSAALTAWDCAKLRALWPRTAQRLRLRLRALVPRLGPDRSMAPARTTFNQPLTGVLRRDRGHGAVQGPRHHGGRAGAKERGKFGNRPHLPTPRVVPRLSVARKTSTHFRCRTARRRAGCCGGPAGRRAAWFAEAMALLDTIKRHQLRAGTHFRIAFTGLRPPGELAIGSRAQARGAAARTSRLRLCLSTESHIILDACALPQHIGVLTSHDWTWCSRFAQRITITVLVAGRCFAFRPTPPKENRSIQVRRRLLSQCDYPRARTWRARSRAQGCVWRATAKPSCSKEHHLALGRAKASAHHRRHGRRKTTLLATVMGPPASNTWRGSARWA